MRGYRDGDLVNKLIETLKKQGVTEDSIVLEWPINHRHRVDLAIIDKVLNKPIALFEIKQTRDKKTVACAESQVKKYASILDEQNIPLFIVFPDPKNDGFLDITQVKFELVKKEPEKTELKEKIGLKDSFEIIVERKEDQLKTSQDQIPNISVLTNSARQKTLFELLKKKENAIENFQLVCWIMGFSSLVILCLNIMNLLALTPERIALFGVIFGLFLLPYASKLKIFGFEFERIKNAEK